jgi:branched-chain amino acid transport system permease protein
MSTTAETAPLPAATGDAHVERWQPSVQGWVARLVILTLVFGGVLWITATAPGFWADRISLAAIYAIIGLSLNMVLGYVGQVSLGHHGFVGIAAFVSAYYVTEQAGCTIEGGCGLSAFATAIIFAVLSGGVAAGLLGLVALRISGLYLALITLSYGFMAERSIFEISFLTRGGAGMPAPRPEGFTSDTQYAFLTLAFLTLVIFIDWRFLRSKVGRAVLSIKHSEPVAASYGINVTAYKTMAFILSGLFAGLAGGLFAFRSTTVVSNDFNFSIALLWVLMVVVGGLGNRVGVVIGSAFFALFPFFVGAAEFARDFFHKLGREESDIGLVLGAALAILTIIQFQGGIGEQISPITRWLGGKKFEGHHGHKAPKGEKKKQGALLAKMGLHKDSEPHAATEDPESVEPGSQAKATSEEQPEELPAPAGSQTTEMPSTSSDDDTPWRRPSSGDDS